MVYPDEKLKKILLISGITGAVYGAFRYLLPLVVPFLFAYGTALCLRPSVRWLHRRLYIPYRGRRFVVPETMIGAVELVAAMGVIACVLYLGGSRLYAQMEHLIVDIPRWISALDRILTELCRGIERTLGLRDGVLVRLTAEMIRELTETVRQATMPKLVTNTVSLVRSAVDIGIFFLIYTVASILFLGEMEEIREKRSRSMFFREFMVVGQRVGTVCAVWLKTQMVIIVITSVLCTVGLRLIGSSYALLAGIGIGLLDALPLFGTGAILIPWGIFMFLRRAWFEGAVLIGLYVVCYLVRQFLEVKIMGDKVGLSSLETLIAMYVGLQLFGLTGLLLGPVGLLIVRDLLELYTGE